MKRIRGKPKSSRGIHQIFCLALAFGGSQFMRIATSMGSGWLSLRSGPVSVTMVDHECQASFIAPEPPALQSTQPEIADSSLRLCRGIYLQISLYHSSPVNTVASLSHFKESVRKVDSIYAWAVKACDYSTSSFLRLE